MHISLTGRAGEVAVDFVTSEEAGNGVNFGADPSHLTTRANATATAVNLNGWKAHMNQALLSGLKPNTTYYYEVGNTKGYSQIFSFVNEPARQVRPSTE